MKINLKDTRIKDGARRMLEVLAELGPPVGVLALRVFLVMLACGVLSFYFPFIPALGFWELILIMFGVAALNGKKWHWAGA